MNRQAGTIGFALQNADELYDKWLDWLKQINNDITQLALPGDPQNFYESVVDHGMQISRRSSTCHPSRTSPQPGLTARLS